MTFMNEIFINPTLKEDLELLDNVINDLRKRLLNLITSPNFNRYGGGKTWPNLIRCQKNCSMKASELINY